MGCFAHAAFFFSDVRLARRTEIGTAKWQVHDMNQAPQDACKSTACSRQVLNRPKTCTACPTSFHMAVFVKTAPKKVCRTCSDDEMASSVTVRFFNDARTAESDGLVIYVRDMREVTD